VKLGWVADVAGLLESGTPPDLSRTLDLCRTMRRGRGSCSWGFSWPGDWREQRLPREIADRIEEDIMVSVLARQSLEMIA
jgi:hypothetical protein